MHNPLDETHRASCLRENLTSSSYGEGLETDRATTQVARQSLTRQLKYDGFRALAVIEHGGFFSIRPAKVMEDVIRSDSAGNASVKRTAPKSSTAHVQIGWMPHPEPIPTACFFD